MKKSPQSSVDGFVPRRSRTIGTAEQPIGEFRRGLSASNRQSISTAPVAPVSAMPSKTKSSVRRRDLDESLSAIDSEDDNQPKKRRIFRRKKNNRVISRRRKITKRAVLIFGLVLMLIGAFIAWKLIFNGSRIFSGNPFDIFQQQRLQTDKNGRTNVLIFGTSGYSMDENNGHDGALLTDSIIVASVNQDTHDAYTVSLPRDLYVQHTCQNSLGTTAGKLNETYYCALNDNNGDETAAAKELMKTAGSILGLDVQYYVHANWSALQQGVDAVGGIDVDIQSSDPRGIYDIGTKVKYPNGIAHINGERALALARARNDFGGYGLAAGNFDREKNQQKIISALQKKATSASTLANPAAVTSLLDALGDNLRTNFQTSEIRTLMDVAKNTIKVTSLPLVSRPDDEPDLVTTGNVGAASIVQPVAGLYQYGDIQAYITKSLFADRTAVIDVLNGSGTAGMAQTKADELQTLGYTIGVVDNAPKEITTSVVIYQVNATKTKAAAALKQKYNTDITEGSLADYTPAKGVDFIIVFGPMKQ